MQPTTGVFVRERREILDPEKRGNTKNTEKRRPHEGDRDGGMQIQVKGNRGLLGAIRN